MRTVDRALATRIVAVVVAMLVILGVSTMSGAAAPDRGSVGFVPSSHPIRFQASSGHIMGLTWIQAKAPIALAGGDKSASDTVYLRLQYLIADELTITQNVNGRALTLSNPNGGNPDTVARIGTPGGVADVWASVTSLDLCITAETLRTIINGYASQFGTQLGEVLGMVADIFDPLADSPAGDVGPCVSLVELLPLLSVIVQAGVPLPDDLPLENLDLQVYAVNVIAGDSDNTLSLPVARIEVDNA